VYLRLPVLGGGDVSSAPYPRLGIARSYPIPLYEIEGFRPDVASCRGVSVAKLLADCIITLPTHEFVSKNDIENIAHHWDS
jgi:hypothetical protein